jgi:hypothetical protein
MSLFAMCEDITVGGDIHWSVGDEVQEEVSPELHGELNKLSKYLQKLYYGRRDQDREWKKVSTTYSSSYLESCRSLHL